MKADEERIAKEKIEEKEAEEVKKVEEAIKKEENLSTPTTAVILIVAVLFTYHHLCDIVGNIIVPQDLMSVHHYLKPGSKLLEVKEVVVRVVCTICKVCP